MRLFLFECKKIFVKQFGFIFIALAVIAKTTFLFLGPDPIRQPAAENIDLAKPFYQRFSGKITAETTKDADALYRDYVQIFPKLISLKKQVDAGEITPETFISETDRLHEKEKGSAAFFLFYNHIIYAKDRPEERFIVYPYGWAALLIPSGLDWILVFLLAVLTAPIFCQEYHTNTIAVLFQGRHGRYKLFAIKMLLTILTAAFCAGVFLALEYFYCLKRFSLPHGSFPLQSLPYFAESLVKKSLCESWLMIVKYRIIGAVLFAVSFQFFGVLTKNALYTIFLGLSAVLIPYIVPILESTKYRLFSPLGFLLAKGFLRPDQYAKIDFEEVPVFLAISPESQRQMTAAALISLFLITGFILIRYCRSVFLIKKLKPFVFFIAVTFLTCCAAGCGSGRDHAKAQIKPVNLIMESGLTWNGKIALSRPFFMLFDPSTHEASRAIKNAFLDSDSYKNLSVNIFKNNDYLYYLLLENTGLTLYRMSSGTFEPEIVYQRYFVSQNPFEPEGSEYSEFIRYATNFKFFVSEDFLTIFSQNQIERINLKTGDRKILAENSAGSFAAFDGTYIYFITTTYQIGKVDWSTCETEYYPNIRSDYLFLTPEKLFFRSIIHNNRPYAMDPATGETERLFDRNINADFVCDEKYLYFAEDLVASKDRSIYRFDFETGETERFSESPLFDLTVLEHSDTLLGFIFADNQIMPVLINKLSRKEFIIPLPD